MRMSCFHDNDRDYFTRHNQVWTDGLYTEAIMPACAGGAVPPIVGHNLAVSFKIMQEQVAETQPVAKFGGWQYFSESHTGEDFVLFVEWPSRSSSLLLRSRRASRSVWRTLAPRRLPCSSCR